MRILRRIKSKISAGLRSGTNAPNEKGITLVGEDDWKNAYEDTVAERSTYERNAEKTADDIEEEGRRLHIRRLEEKRQLKVDIETLQKEIKGFTYKIFELKEEETKLKQYLIGNQDIKQNEREEIEKRLKRIGGEIKKLSDGVKVRRGAIYEFELKIKELENKNIPDNEAVSITGDSDYYEASNNIKMN